MTTSGTTTSSLTVHQIATQALEMVGYQDADETMSPADAASVMRQLNWMLKSWQADGVVPWRDQLTTLTWPADTAEGSISPTILDILSLRYEVSTGIERELIELDSAQYASIPNKTQTGEPNSFHFVKQIAAPHVFLWPVPGSDVTLNLNVTRVVEDVTALTQTLDVPQEWTETVYVNLADRLPFSFKTALSPADRQDLSARAGALYRALKSLDHTGSVFIGL